MGVFRRLFGGQKLHVEKSKPLVCYLCGVSTAYRCNVCGKYVCIKHSEVGTQSCVECAEKKKVTGGI